MPVGSQGFTPINQSDSFSSDTHSSPTPSKHHRQDEARTRRKHPIIKEYLSPGKTGSMFERAAISQGEVPQVKKRKILKNTESNVKDNNAQPSRQPQGRPKTTVRRVVSEGMRVTKPGAFVKTKPQDPSFNPRSAADTWISPSDDVPQNATHDNISVVAPLTSMDIISSPASSSTTLSSATMLGRSSQSSLYQPYNSSQAHTSGTSHNSHARQQRRSHVIQPATENCKSDNSHVLDSSIHHANAKLFTQSKQTPSKRGARVFSQSPRLETIDEEIEPDAIYGGRHTSRPVGQRKNLTIRENTSTADTDRPESPADEFDIFGDGLSEIDLLNCLDEDAVSTFDTITDEVLPDTPPRRPEEEPPCTFDASPVGDDDFFEEDWGVLEDEDIHVLEQVEASMERATTLNRITSNTQKVHATPVVVSSACTETNGTPPLGPKPILRPPFPDAVQDRSPILGLSAAMLLRTCFRIGEALNVGSQAARERQTVIIELYARVRSSFREPRSVKQHFTFMDLFHDRPPYLDGVYETWKGVELYEQDSGRFLEHSARPLTCRCMGKLKREGESWKLTILNIWEATMDDVDYAIGLIES